ncbi:hypothetical protein D9M71_702220 [compost metagenome]
MVAHGVGVGIVPQAIAKRFKRRYSLQTCALADDWAQRQLCLCFREWSELTALMQNLLTHLGGTPGKD